MTGAVVGEPEVGKTKSTSYWGILRKFAHFQKIETEGIKKTFSVSFIYIYIYLYKSKIASLTPGVLVIKFKELLTFFLV